MKILRFFGLLFLVAFGLTLFFVRQLSVESGDSSVRIEIASGQSLSQITDSLKSQGLVTSSTLFRWYLEREDLDTKIQPGIFEIPLGSTYEDIARFLAASPEQSEMRVTIPEGFTLMQIDTLLANQGLIEPGSVVRCAESACDFSMFSFLPSSHSAMTHGPIEGYLYPDTYFVNATEFSVEVFLRRLLRTFEQRVVQAYADDVTESKRALHEIITMASLIERETRKESERALVSGVLWKRYDVGTVLGVDATVRYALDKPTAAITRADLDSDSPYNTRKFAGLPPGPIANPSLSSIQAALNPAQSAYWFYLHDPTGQIHFSETNDEHNLKKAKYLR